MHDDLLRSWTLKVAARGLSDHLNLTASSVNGLTISSSSPEYEWGTSVI